MTKEEVIALANNTGLFDYFDLEGDSAGQLILHNFAALVYEHTWKEANIAATRTVLDAAVLAEREACAKVCDEQADKDKWEGHYAHQCAAAIRSRT